MDVMYAVFAGAKNCHAPYLRPVGKASDYFGQKNTASKCGINENFRISNSFCLILKEGDP